MRSTLIAFTLLAATAASAQTKPSTVQVQAAAPSGCPVGITASHRGSPAAIWITSLEDADKSPAELRTMHTGVHVDLNASHKEIKQAELDVFFLPPGTRVLPVAGSQFAPSPAPAPETSKEFSLVSGKNPSLELDGNLLLGPVASITHVSLMHVIYTDGTEWKAHNSHSCSIQPSLFMPVETK